MRVFTSISYYRSFDASGPGSQGGNPVPSPAILSGKKCV